MRKSVVGVAALFLGFGGAALAASVSDPVGDFAPGFVGSDADLDVTSFSVNYDSSTSTFLLNSTLAGAIDPSVAGLYVIGVNTGTGPAAPFGSLGAPNVKFNQVILVQKNGTGSVSGAAGGPLVAGAILISGNQFSVTVPLALLPTTGFLPEDYGFNLWPRNGANQISDFAPDNAMLPSVPEPESWAMLIAGFGVTGAMMRRRKTPRTVSVA